MKLEERTVERKYLIFSKNSTQIPFTLENNINKIKQYVHKLKQKNEFKCYEIISEEEFANYSQIKKIRKLGVDLDKSGKSLINKNKNSL